MNRLEIGKIINTHGLRGEVKVVTWTDSPEDFDNIKNVYATLRTGDVKLTISRVKYQKNNIIIKFKEIDVIEEAEQYKNAVLSAERDELPPLPEGVHYIVDMIDCVVIDTEGNEIGVLADVFRAGAGNVYTIKRKGQKELLLPANDDTVLSIDIEAKQIRVCIPEGLED